MESENETLSAKHPFYKLHVSILHMFFGDTIKPTFYQTQHVSAGAPNQCPGCTLHQAQEFADGRADPSEDPKNLWNRLPQGVPGRIFTHKHIEKWSFPVEPKWFRDLKFNDPRNLPYLEVDANLKIMFQSISKSGIGAVGRPSWEFAMCFALFAEAEPFEFWSAKTPRRIPKTSFTRRTHARGPFLLVEDHCGEGHYRHEQQEFQVGLHGQMDGPGLQFWFGLGP